MKKIVVPTDFSAGALNALKVAAKIAKDYSASITLLHVYEKPVYGHLYYVVDSRENSKIIDRINKELNTISKMDFLTGLIVKKVILNDISVWEMLLDENLLDTDLIVMGTHGSNGVKECLIGSNAEKVARLSKWPVLSIRNTIEEFTPKNIVFASDFKEKTDHVAFQVIKKVADKYFAKIHFLRVNTPKNFESTNVSIKKINQFISNYGLSQHTINLYNYQSVKEGIICFAGTIDADLISLATHGRTGVSHLINGSIAEDVLNHALKPVLSINVDGAT